MASLILRLGGGTYSPSHMSGLSGSSIDWFYSYNHYLNGISNLAYLAEIGTAFYQSINDLDIIFRENFKALKYLARFTDSIVYLCEGVVPPPVIYPLDTVGQTVCLFNNVNVIANNITDTTYAFTNHAVGEYYYYVRGYNTTWGWGGYSCLEKIVVSDVGFPEIKHNDKKGFMFSVYPNPFTNYCVIKFQFATHPQFEIISKLASIKIFDSRGRLVKSFNHLINCSFDQVVWSGEGDSGRLLPVGVYFVRLETENFKKVEKIIILR